MKPLSLRVGAQQGLGVLRQTLFFHGETHAASTTVTGQHGACAIHITLAVLFTLSGNVKHQCGADFITTIDRVIAEAGLLGVKVVAKVKLGTSTLGLGNQELVQLVSGNISILIKEM